MHKLNTLVHLHCNLVAFYKTGKNQVLIIVVDDTSNFHFDTISSSLGISIDGIEILDNMHAYNTCTYINVKFYTNSVKNMEAV